jgi:hypothetical protein
MAETIVVTPTINEITVTPTVQAVTLASSGPQGPKGDNGVATATAPITYDSGTQTVGIDQTGLTLAQSQVTGLVSALAGTAKLGSANAFTAGGHTITSEGVGVINLTLRLIASQTAAPFRIRNSADNGDVFQVDTSGQIRLPAILNSNTFSNCRLQIQDTGLRVDTGVAANVPLRVQNTNSSPTGNLTEWLSSGGTPTTIIAPNGQIGTTARVTVGQTTISTDGQLSVTGNTDRVQFAIRGNGTQTTDLQQWLNNGGTSLASVSSGGGFVAQFVQVQSGGLVQLASSNSGGVLRMTKQTAAYANPGANIAGLYFRDGTTGGTLKLVVRAGATGSEITILDNIPT